jgi:hypothetical protein
LDEFFGPDTEVNENKVNKFCAAILKKEYQEEQYD